MIPEGDILQDIIISKCCWFFLRASPWTASHLLSFTRTRSKSRNCDFCWKKWKKEKNESDDLIGRTASRRYDHLRWPEQKLVAHGRDSHSGWECSSRSQSEINGLIQKAQNNLGVASLRIILDSARPSDPDFISHNHSLFGHSQSRNIRLFLPQKRTYLTETGPKISWDRTNLNDKSDHFATSPRNSKTLSYVRAQNHAADSPHRFS